MGTSRPSTNCSSTWAWTGCSATTPTRRWPPERAADPRKAWRAGRVVPAGPPFADEDVWVFNLPGNQATTGTFQTITATFSTPGGPVTRTIPTDPNSAIVNDLGTSKAWIRTPAGWTLTGATAVISGTARFFVLTHTCAAGDIGLSLTLTKTGTPASGLKAGQVVTYTYTVGNASTGTTDPITAIAITDDKVTGITCATTSLAPGASTTCTGTYTVTEADVAAGEIVNIARANGSFGEQQVTSNEATFTVTTVTPPPVRASLSIDKKARVESACKNECEPDGYAAKGDKILYTYRVTNTGTVTITDVAVVDPASTCPSPAAARRRWSASVVGCWPRAAC
ncbi:hypothetical protein ACFFKH_01615 [Micromonospora marina]|uniref:DUF7507 domain-containing protein n=1 Tax=Micromonospora marina TaxID=307120 RepID=UPI000B86D9A6|nr:hypothetical protein [Micromonospora marina]